MSLFQEKWRGENFSKILSKGGWAAWEERDFGARHVKRQSNDKAGEGSRRGRGNRWNRGEKRKRKSVPVLKREDLGEKKGLRREKKKREGINKGER